MSLQNFKSGSTTGTGAAINVSLGWNPDFVMVINATDGDILDVWHSDMTTATAVSIAAAASTRATNGISHYAGSTTAAVGFTIGSDISESAKTLVWIAMRDSQ